MALPDTTPQSHGTDVSPGVSRVPSSSKLPARTTDGGSNNASNGVSNPLAAILATHLSVANPFLTWYDPPPRSSAHPHGILRGRDGQAEQREYHKADLIRANFIRVAKVLVRRSNVDRERLACWEYWMGVRSNGPHSRILARREGRDRNDDIDYGHDSSDEEDAASDARPDIRDVWDLLEAKVGCAAYTGLVAGADARRNPCSSTRSSSCSNTRIPAGTSSRFSASSTHLRTASITTRTGRTSQMARQSWMRSTSMVIETRWAAPRLTIPMRKLQSRDGSHFTKTCSGD